MLLVDQEEFCCDLHGGRLGLRDGAKLAQPSSAIPLTPGASNVPTRNSPRKNSPSSAPGTNVAITRLPSSRFSGLRAATRLSTCSSLHSGDKPTTISFESTTSFSSTL